jgi:hypothetical protein
VSRPHAEGAVAWCSYQLAAGSEAHDRDHFGVLAVLAEIRLGANRSSGVTRAASGERGDAQSAKQR